MASTLERIAKRYASSCRRPGSLATPGSPAAAPSPRDVTEHPVLHLVPFARARWRMAHPRSEAPSRTTAQPAADAATTTAVSRDQQAPRRRMGHATHPHHQHRNVSTANAALARSTTTLTQPASQRSHRIAARGRSTSFSSAATEPRHEHQRLAACAQTPQRS